MSRTQMFEPLEQRKLLTAYYGTDLFDAGLTALFVEGTVDDDKIEITPAASPSDLEVFIDGTSIGVFAPTGRVVVRGLGGDDSIKVDPSICRPAELSGDDGNDTLKGGSGDDVLTGRAGDDLIKGGEGRDLLLGGFGADTLKGNEGDDLLSAGESAMDDITRILGGFRAHLNQVIEIWTDPVIGYEDRRSALIFGDPSILNFDNVHSDDDPDFLTGGPGRDLFLPWSIGLGDTVFMTPDEEVFF